MTNSFEKPEPQREKEEIALEITKGLYNYKYNWILEPDIFMTREERKGAENIEKEIKENKAVSPDEKGIYQKYQIYQKNKLRKNWFAGTILHIETALRRGLITDENLKEELISKTKEIREKIRGKIYEEGEKEIIQTEEKLEVDDVSKVEELMEKTINALLENLSEEKKKEFSEWVEKQ